MNIHRTPDTMTKISQMGDATLFEPAGDVPRAEERGGEKYQALSLADCISNVQTPFGAKPILKTMVTTACERNCNYCVFRAGRGKTKRVTISPDALAAAFDQLQRAKLADGMFLSSGIIKGGVAAQDKIIATGEIIRKKYRYRGFLHLKIMPGAEYDQIHRLMQLADRVSVNLEGPTEARLQALAPKKNFSNELLIQLQRAHEIKQKDPTIRASLVTQFVVGAVGDTDLELLSLGDRLYNRLGLKRTYFSAFGPVRDTPFENLPATDPIREFRLYQASFLLRDYAWDLEDLPFVGGDNLRTDMDPKRAWAEVNLRNKPIDVMKADRTTLMRLPGVGPKGADAIMNARAERALRDLSQLGKLGIRTPEQLAPYVLFDGKQPSQQLSLF